MNPFQLFKAKRKFKFNIVSHVGVMSQLIVLVEPEFILIDSQGIVPFHTEFLPVLKPFLFFSGSYKILHFHLLKFPHTKNELTGHDFISKSFSNLGNTEW